ncbi:maleylpyruvate isomerase family mycothiol-dependent enzyme [Georgenia thermotolerans]|uniref:Maleylpyruvate isomerase family mycothiol-dependent enzyme n=1 Tax=Georgenia thermotolerans TaxID=527326 RepID=A0A7J5UNB7_9MICO|nr:maleylpyruvate isomerase family mycothiol-dependent enzyme [Georgenia thermotolerans]KAE8763892.1 maleylpyruvate isomerase family mycothiol-dependent enzyme [Georgenia thermotolerans]
MSVTSEEAAREALRQRQGAGARYDSPAAPARELAWARRGTAYFARKLNELTDAELYEPSLLPGWTRAHLVAHVGYNARALTRLVEWARTGVETPMYASTEQRNAEIERGATLPARALRNLFAHAEVHLNVEWRDLTDAGWDAQVRTAQGRLVPARETAWMRTREVWVHAVDLDNGGSFHDFPPDLLAELLADVQRSWARREERVDLTLAPTGGEPVVIGDGGPTVSGALPDLVRWLTGRGARRLTGSDGEIPDIPRWF